MLLLNISAHKEVISALEANGVMDALLQVVFNVMKTLDKTDLALRTKLLVDVGGTRLGAGGEIFREVQANKEAKVTQEDVVPVLNIENLRLALLVLNNMCAQSLASKRQLLQIDADEKTKGTHFIVLLGWFLVDDYELLFESFAGLVNSLTEEDTLKEFLLSPTIKLEQRLKRYLIHSNNLIRGAVLPCIRHLFFSHENPHLAERFMKFEPEEVHLIELNTRCLWMALQQKYNITPTHKQVIEKTLGSVWKPIKTLKTPNPRVQTVEEEIDHSLDIFLVSTNFDFPHYFPNNEQAEKEPVLQMRKVLALFADYAKEPSYRDRIGAIMSCYTGEIII